MGSTLEQARAAVAEAERRSVELQAKTEALTKLEKDIHKSIKLAEDAETELEKSKKFSIEIKETKGKITETKAKIREMATNEQVLSWLALPEPGAPLMRALSQHVKRQLTAKNEKLFRLQKQVGLKTQAAIQLLEDV